MTGPITPHLEITPCDDGVHIRLRHVDIVVPANMADSIADKLKEAASTHRDSNLTPLPLPVVVPKKGDPKTLPPQ